MSTDTTETTKETTDVLPANLVKLPSQELHDRSYAIHEEANTALEYDQWAEYKKLSDQASLYDAEIDRRGAAARKETPIEPAKAPVAALEKIEQARQQLAAAEKAMEEFAGFTPRGVVPPPMGETAEESDTTELARADAFVNVEKLRAELATLEGRIPFLDVSDEDVATGLEDSAIEIEGLRIDLKTFQESGRRAATAKAERQLAEVTERHYQLMGENEIRKGERTKEALIEQLSERKALAYREQALKDWTQRKKELEELLHREVRQGESQHYDMAPLREATEAVDAYTKALKTGQPLAADEIARQRVALEASAPHVRGSFR